MIVAGLPLSMAPHTITGAAGIIARSPDQDAVADLADRLADEASVVAVAWHRGPEHAVLRASGDAAALVDAALTLPEPDVHEVRSRRLRRHRVTWPLGAATPGVGILFDVRRNVALDQLGFHTHWRDTHGPVALAHHLGMWDYEQVSIIDGDGSALDGVAVVQFPDHADASERFFDSPEGAAVVGADAASFTDAATLSRQRTTEYVLVPPPLPDSGAHDWADHRSVALAPAVGDVWNTVSAAGFGPLAGTAAAERQRRDDEHMLWVELRGGLPDGVVDATSRFEVRADADGTRLDWSVRALVAAGAEDAFGRFVDGLWAEIGVALG